LRSTRRAPHRPLRQDLALPSVEDASAPRGRLPARTNLRDRKTERTRKPQECWKIRCDGGASEPEILHLGGRSGQGWRRSMSAVEASPAGPGSDRDGSSRAGC
jgi:hypothetical protein